MALKMGRGLKEETGREKRIVGRKEKEDKEGKMQGKERARRERKS